MNERVNWKKTLDNIRVLMTNYNYTIPAFAEALSLSTPTLKNYLYGTSIPPIDVLYAMEKLFHLNNLNELLIFE